MTKTNKGKEIDLASLGWEFASRIDAERDESGNVLLYEDMELKKEHIHYRGYLGQLYCRLITEELADVPCLYAIVVDNVIVFSGRDMHSLRNRFSSSFMVVSDSEHDDPNGTNARINHLILNKLNGNHIVKLYYKPYDKNKYSNDFSFRLALRRDADNAYDLFDEPEWVQRRPINGD